MMLDWGWGGGRGVGVPKTGQHKPTHTGTRATHGLTHAFTHARAHVHPRIQMPTRPATCECARAYAKISRARTPAEYRARSEGEPPIPKP